MELEEDGAEIDTILLQLHCSLLFIGLLETSGGRFDEGQISLDLLNVLGILDLLCESHSLQDEVALPLVLDHLDPLHSIDALCPELAVVLDRHIAPLLKLERRIDRQLLAGRLTERLGPLRLAGVLLLEVPVAFRPAKPEDLAVVPHKG